MSSEQLAIQNAVRVADIRSLNALYISKAHVAAHEHVAGFYIRLSICCPILVRAVYHEFSRWPIPVKVGRGELWSGGQPS